MRHKCNKIIDLGGNLRWNGGQIFGRRGFIDGATIIHYISGFLMYTIFNRAIHDVTITSIVVILIHIIQDFTENIKICGYNFSFEGLYGRMIGCFNESFLAANDNDTLENFIGDNLFYILGVVTGIYTEQYTEHLSVWIFVGIFVGILLLYIPLCYLFKK